MLEETPRIKELRQKYKIPERYGTGWEMPDGQIHFDFCDSTIAIHPDGSATETHKGMVPRMSAESVWTLEDVRALCRGLGWKEVIKERGFHVFAVPGRRWISIESKRIRLAEGLDMRIVHRPESAIAWLLST